MTKRRLPHRFPPRETWPNGDPECIAWKCWECGAMISEYGPKDEEGCSVDWHKKIHGGKIRRAWRELWT